MLGPASVCATSCERTDMRSKDSSGTRKKPTLRSVPVPEQGSSDESASGFSVSSAGVFFRSGKGEQRRICSEVRVLARVRDASSTNWGIFAAVTDPDGREHRTLLGWEMFERNNGAGIREELRRLGCVIERGQNGYLIDYLQEPTDARGTLAAQTGWHGDVFVLPEEVRGTSEEEYHYAGPRVCFAVSGTWQDWRDHVGRLCGGNPRLILSVSTALAGPLLRLVGVDNFGVHFRGASTSGKSTALALGASVWGKPTADEADGILGTWRKTGNALEDVAASRNDLCLMLDELGQLDPREASHIAYDLTSGVSKTRMKREGGLREDKYWRCTFLSTGEIGLADHARAAGQRTNVGAGVRLIDVVADGGAFGMFDELHRFADAASFADELRESARRYHGAVGRAFLEGLVELKRHGEAFDERRSLILRLLPAVPTEQLRRVQKSLSVSALAGELATEFGLTGWERGAATNAIAAIVDDLCGDTEHPSGEVVDFIERVETLIGQQRHRFEPRYDEVERPVINRAGWLDLRPAQKQAEYSILTTVWTNEVKCGASKKTVRQACEHMRWKLSKAKKLNKGGEQLYAYRLVVPAEEADE